MKFFTTTYRNTIIVSLIFLASLGTLVAGTLAWFSVSNLLRIQTFRITVGQPENIEIGLIVPEHANELGQPGEIIYYNYVDDALLSLHHYYDSSVALKPVSSMYQSLWLNESTDLSDSELFPQFRTSYGPGTNHLESDLANDGYYQFPVYIRSSIDVFIYLDANSYLRADTNKNAKIANRYGLEKDDLDRVANFMRISFLTEEGYRIWEPNVAVARTTEFGGQLDIRNFDYTYDYHHQTNKEYMYGEYNDESYLVYDESARISSTTSFSSFSANTHPEAIPLDINQSKDAGLVVVKEQSHTLTQLSNFSNPAHRLLHLYPNEPKRMVISVYAEGWDRDLTNDSRYANFQLNLALGGLYAPII